MKQRNGKPSFVKVLALVYVWWWSLSSDAEIRMKGYIMKGLGEPVSCGLRWMPWSKGFYYSELVTVNWYTPLPGMKKKATARNCWGLSDRETEFLKLACSEMSYKEIAAQMHLSPEQLTDTGMHCLKLDIKSRTDIGIYAIKQGIYQVWLFLQHKVHPIARAGDQCIVIANGFCPAAMLREPHNRGMLSPDQTQHHRLPLQSGSSCRSSYLEWNFLHPAYFRLLLIVSLMMR